MVVSTIRGIYPMKYFSACLVHQGGTSTFDVVDGDGMMEPGKAIFIKS